MQEGKLLATLRHFIKYQVEFVVVGGVAAVLNGAPIQTYDIDLVYFRSEENIARLLVVLGELEAVFRVQPERRLRPTASHLAGTGHLNLLTRLGPLDLLAFIGTGLTYVDLLPLSSEMEIGQNARIRVLNLDTLIRLKVELGGSKDLAVLPALRQTLKELRKEPLE